MNPTSLFKMFLKFSFLIMYLLILFPKRHFFKVNLFFTAIILLLGTTIAINNIEIKFSNIDGIVFRPSRSWIPSAININDLPFIYNETLSAWFSMLSTLSTPVVNRYGIGWWLHDVNYDIQLLQNLSSYTHIPICPSDFFNRNTTLDKSSTFQSIYLIGKKIFYPNNISKVTFELTEKNYDKIILWGEKNGIIFCRIDFEKKYEIELKNIDIFPIINYWKDEVRIICKHLSDIFI